MEIGTKRDKGINPVGLRVNSSVITISRADDPQWYSVVRLKRPTGGRGGGKSGSTGLLTCRLME